MSDYDPVKEEQLRRMNIYTFYFRLLDQKERADKEDNKSISDSTQFGKGKNWQ